MEVRKIKWVLGNKCLLGVRGTQLDHYVISFGFNTYRLERKISGSGGFSVHDTLQDALIEADRDWSAFVLSWLVDK